MANEVCLFTVGIIRLNDAYWVLDKLKVSQSEGLQLLIIDLGYAINAINNELSLEQQRKENETL